MRVQAEICSTKQAPSTKEEPAHYYYSKPLLSTVEACESKYSTAGFTSSIWTKEERVHRITESGIVIFGNNIKCPHTGQPQCANSCNLGDNFNFHVKFTLMPVKKNCVMK